MGRKVNAGSDLEFIAPIKKGDGVEVASISRSDILDNVNKWSNTLVGYVMGNKSFFLHLKGCVSGLWKPNCFLDIFFQKKWFSSSLNLVLMMNVMSPAWGSLAF